MRTVIGITVEEHFSDGAFSLMETAAGQNREKQGSIDLGDGQRSCQQQPDKGFIPGNGAENVHPQDIIIRVQGEGFLYNMVRIISGTLIKVGLHGWPPEYVKEILESRDRTRAGRDSSGQGVIFKRN